MSEQKIEWLEVDPEIARELLSNFATNRNSNQAVIAKYTRAMKDGKWYMIGEPICITNQGSVLNGMHRLKAVVASGCTVTLPVIWNVPAAAMASIDTGMPRGYHHIQQMRGIKNATHVSAVTRRLWLWDQGIYLQSGNITASYDELDAYLQQNPGIPALVASVKGSRLPPYTPPSIAAVCRFIFGRISSEYEKAFWEGWSTGADLALDSPLLQLRQRFATDVNLRTHRNTGEMKIALACTAWNAFRKNKRVSKLQLPKGGITNASYPLPI